MKAMACAVYILTNARNTVLYTGVTSNLPKRVWEHRQKLDRQSFTARYNIAKLVWFETTSSIRSAIVREKQVKAGSRADKIRLIETKNPGWRDLWEDLFPKPAKESSSE
jgi:putative endonuclease